jgi:hypothetical protein
MRERESERGRDLY